VSVGARTRVFFALWPDLSVRSVLAQVAAEAQAECGGRATPLPKLHVTLFFVGDVERARIGALESCAGTVRAGSFELDMSVLGYWRHNRIVWAGARRSPAALGSLVAQLTANLALAGMAAEDRPYVPHVTLVRNARAATTHTRLNPPVWDVREFVLVESVRAASASRYDVLARWPLAPRL
jgi:2'-5' RNA ligase